MHVLTHPARRLLAFLAASFLLIAPTAAQDAARTLSETVPLDADGEVTIDNHEGSITVTTWDRAEVQYEIRIMPTDEDPKAEKTRIDINHSDRRLSLTTSHSEGDDESSVFGWSFEDGFQWGGTNIPAVHYTLTMPKTARLTLDDHESEIEVTGLQAPLRIDTHEGPITVASQRGDIVLDTHESRMQLHDVQGRVEIDTHEGRMRLRDIDGRVEIDTHEGEVIAENLRGSFELNTHDGEADLSFAALTDDVSIDSHDARITLTVPAHAPFTLDTDFDDDADLTSDFDLSSIRIADEDDDDEVNYRGAINGGGPLVYLSSHDGDFQLRTR